MRITKALLIALSCVTLGVLAEEPKPAAEAAKPVFADAAMAGLRPVYGRLKDINVRAAEKMPEESYGFKPTPEVKTFGQFVGHLADSNTAMCRAAMGEGFKFSDEIEKSKTGKAELVKALKDSYEFCDKVMGLSDADLGKPMKFFGTDSSRFAAANLLVGHGFEHYGNMVTYLRMKGLVPPSSEPPPAAPKGAEKTDAGAKAGDKK